MTKAADGILPLLGRLGVSLEKPMGDSEIVASSPIDGSVLARLTADDSAAAAAAVGRAQAAFLQWRRVPAPRRGELVRRLGEVLREHKSDLGLLVTLETGKILSEGRGEVQEMIDICDYAVGLSRQLYGLTIASERPGHHMLERWHPLGPVAVISAFNFPVAVWAWNAALALVCGNPVIWKPSEKAPLCAVAVQALFDKACEGFDDAPAALSQVLRGGPALGQLLTEDPRVSLVSATGSTRMGRAVGERLATRFGRPLLELGGNAAMIVAPTADLDMALRAICFGAAGTAGQRCTSLRRLIVHKDVAGVLSERLVRAYASFSIGDPRDQDVLIGPLIDEAAADAFEAAIARAIADGGEVLVGGDRVGEEGGAYVRPAIVRMPGQTGVVREEVFGPILYLMTYEDFDDAITIQNGVPQGLSSCIFTNDVREAETFLSAVGSDCGIANVNIGPSGAEIGGAFGGEKETGGGRESGSDAWRAYMRRQTQTVNYSKSLPLAQGVRFDVG